MPLRVTLIARRWPCAFFLSDSKGMLDVKDTVLRRELASIALATRKIKNFFRVYHINSLILCVCVCVRGFSMFSHRKIAESSGCFCSVIFLGWWLSFEHNFEAQLALEVPQRAFRPSFSDPTHSRDRRFDLAGSSFDFDRLSAADRCRSFASVRKMTSEARIQREKQKFGCSASKRSV